MYIMVSLKWFICIHNDGRGWGNVLIAKERSMRKIQLKAVSVWAAMILIGIMAFMGVLRSEESKNARVFEKNVREKCTDYISVSLNELTPFEWDKMYSFPPYMPKEQMYEMMGFESGKVSETFNEGQVNIVFTHGNEVACTISGYNQTFGIGGKIELSSSENPTFIVTRTGSEEGLGGKIWLQWYGDEEAVKTVKGIIDPEMAGIWKCDDVKEY